MAYGAFIETVLGVVRERKIETLFAILVDAFPIALYVNGFAGTKLLGKDDNGHISVRT